MKVFKDFLDFIFFLQKYEVEYLIVGGYAVGIHSQPRMTQDIDFWIKPSIENARNLMKALDEFGVPDVKFDINDLINPNIVIQFGNPPMRIDILSSIDGVEFDKAFGNKFVHNLENLKDVNFISFNDLVKNKKASKRKKDSYDLEWLKDYGKSSKKI